MVAKLYSARYKEGNKEIAKSLTLPASKKCKPNAPTKPLALKSVG